MKDESFLRPVPNPEKTGWKSETKGTGWFRQGKWKDLKATLIRSRQEKMGWEISYGHGPEGYDQWIIREQNGGGTVIAPYAWIEGELYIGVIKQKRGLTEKFVSEASRGASIPGEKHDATASREFSEETGAGSLAKRARPIGGKPINPSSSFFQANPGKGEGIKLYAIRLNQDELVLRKEMHTQQTSPQTGITSTLDTKIYKLRPDLQQEIKEVDEEISPEGLRFIHAKVLANTSDAPTLALLGRLLTKTAPEDHV